MNVRKTQARKKQNPAMKTINGRTYEQGGNLKRKEIISLLAERMAQLPELQKKVLAMYYHENMQLFKIAAIFGVDRVPDLPNSRPGGYAAPRLFDRTVCLSPGD